MKRTDPKLKAVALWSSFLFGAIFWITAFVLGLAVIEWIAQAF